MIVRFLLLLLLLIFQIKINNGYGFPQIKRFIVRAIPFCVGTAISTLTLTSSSVLAYDNNKLNSLYISNSVIEIENDFDRNIKSILLGDSNINPPAPTTSTITPPKADTDEDMLFKLKEASGTPKTNDNSVKLVKSQIDLAREKVLTLKAYLDEAERDLILENWDRLAVYLYTFTEQEYSFAALIDGLFPSDDSLDSSARTALSFEAQSMFETLETLKDAARNKQIDASSKVYARLLLSYDRFLNKSW